MPLSKYSKIDIPLFSYKSDYETTGWFNGNIGKQSWHNGAAERNYTFAYDNAKRLKSATYTGINGENYSIPNMNYDRNGNITNLQRNGKTGSGFGQIDNLSYSYNGNRLSQITDAIAGNNTVDFVPRGSGDYTYYNDGSLKSDANEQISNILYDSYLQQPIEVQLTDGRKINHYYDGHGKLLKTVYSTGEIWEYADGFIYKNGALYQVQDDEGRILYQNGVFQYEFHYTDHLGNTRVSFKANGNQLEKVAETAFDPWGVVLNGLGQQNATPNRWEFLNREKESTFGLNLIRLGERGYNPTNGRFDRVDSKPDVAGQESLTTYQYGLNNPVLQSDPNGDCPKCWEAIKSWLTAPISPEAQNIGQAYMISSTGLDSKPQNRWQLIAAVMGQAGQHFGGSTPGNLKIRIPKSNSSKINTSSKSIPQKGDFVFRGDERSPDIVFNEGFKSKGDNTNLEQHVKYNPDDDAYISTTKSPKVAASGDYGEYVYTIKDTKTGKDVNQEMGQGRFSYEQEIAIPYLIPSQNIMGVRKADNAGKFTGPFIKNPNCQQKSQ